MWSTFAKFDHGYSLAANGSFKEGCAEIRDAFRRFDSMGMVLSQVRGHALLADALMLVGKPEKAIASLDELLSKKSEERVFASESCRLRGELVSRLEGAYDGDSIAVAESHLRQAVEIAQLQSAKSLELRATTSLARLLGSQGKRGEARTMLAEIYGWFTEGFDTKDLKEAKALLDELSN